MRSRIPALVLAALVLLAPAGVLAFSGGPLPDRVGLCGTGPTCAGCHSNAGAVSDALIAVTLNGAPAPVPPATGVYTPDANYNIVITVLERNYMARCQHAQRRTACGDLLDNQCAFGFELTAVTETSCLSPVPEGAGCFVESPTGDTQCVGGPCPPCMPGPQQPTYHEHTCQGHIPIGAQLDGRTWTFDWTAPPAGTGGVHFYYYVNSANGNGNSGGDEPYPGDFLLLEQGAPPPCGLLRAAIASVSPPPPQFKTAFLFTDTTTCPPDAVPAGPPYIPGFTTLGMSIVEPVPGAEGLVVYQVACPCAGTLQVYKSGGNVIGVWQ